MKTDQLARWIIGFVWIYHGLFTKLIMIASIEHHLSSQIGLSDTGTYWFIKAAGVGEVLFGLTFICLYRYKAVIYLNIFTMVSLIVMVAFLDVRYLVEGFNPVTTNIPVIGLSIILLSEIERRATIKDAFCNAS